MYTQIFQNSYIVAIIVFVVLIVFFYIFQIGYTSTVEYTGDPGCVEKGNCTSTKVVKKFSWKYPLVIAIMVWLIWHFCLFPPQEIREMNIKTSSPSRVNAPTQKAGYIPSSEANMQKINMINWN